MSDVHGGDVRVRDVRLVYEVSGEGPDLIWPDSELHVASTASELAGWTDRAAAFLRRVL